MSACLLGDPVRYDGKAKRLAHDRLQRLQTAGRVVAFCPEVAGGLAVPRAAAEIVGGDGADVIGGRSSRIYDGSFTRRSIAASGVTTALLRQHGIRVFSQHQVDAAINSLGPATQTAPPKKMR